MWTIVRVRLGWALLLVGLAGCGGGGPHLARVSGTVTLDDRPLANALVEFIPANGRPSSGVTDAQGRYELAYSHTRIGALVGRHQVRISTYRSGGEDYDGTRTPGAPEQVPAVYNRQSTLTREVASGRQKIDFELDSSAGPVPTDGRG